MTALLVALGAALGAPLRYAASSAWDVRWPAGTWMVNVAGSALLGVFAALALDGRWWALLATGFCGGLTSFSAFAVQAVDAGRPRGTSYVVATVVCSVAACAVGLALGLALR